MGENSNETFLNERIVSPKEDKVLLAVEFEEHGMLKNPPSLPVLAKLDSISQNNTTMDCYNCVCSKDIAKGC
jgi:hypothetical protein